MTGDAKLRAMERAAIDGDDQTIEAWQAECKRRGIKIKTKADLDEETRQARINRILDYMFRPESEGGLDLGSQGEFDMFNGVAGETDELVVVGNWNERTQWVPFHGPRQRIMHKRWEARWKDENGINRKDGRFVEEEIDQYLGGMRETIDDTPKRLGDVLEKLGVETDWSDGFLRCDCGKGFRTQPDGYGWEMHGYIGDGDWMCGDCLESHQCDTCGLPDIEYGHCHQREFLNGGDDQSGDDPRFCHCGVGCEHDQTEEDDGLDDA